MMQSSGYESIIFDKSLIKYAKALEGSNFFDIYHPWERNTASILRFFGLTLSGRRPLACRNQSIELQQINGVVSIGERPPSWKG